MLLLNELEKLRADWRRARLASLINKRNWYPEARICVLVLQVEREGLGLAPGYLLLWDRKSHALERMKTKRGSMRKRVAIVVL